MKVGSFPSVKGGGSGTFEDLGGGAGVLLRLSAWTRVSTQVAMFCSVAGVGSVVS